MTDSNHASLVAATSAIPSFCSATKFPKSPKPDQLLRYYKECMQALNDANKARYILKARMEAKKNIISEIRLEIQRIEHEFSPQGPARVSLHAMQRKLYEDLREMEHLTNELDELVFTALRVGPRRVGQLIGKLKALVRRWRAFQFQRQQGLANNAMPEHDGGNHD